MLPATAPQGCPCIACYAAVIVVQGERRRRAFDERRAAALSGSKVKESRNRLPNAGGSPA